MMIPLPNNLLKKVLEATFLKTLKIRRIISSNQFLKIRTWSLIKFSSFPLMCHICLKKMRVIFSQILRISKICFKIKTNCHNINVISFDIDLCHKMNDIVGNENYKKMYIIFTTFKLIKFYSNFLPSINILDN